MKKIKFIKQHDSMQCGAASLAMICNIFGKKTSLKYVESLCGASHDGVSMLAIKNAALDIGLDSIVAAITIEDLSNCPTPMILFWNHKHYVVLYNIDKKNQNFI